MTDHATYYIMGRRAYQDGKRSDANPFQFTAKEYADWRTGWKDEAVADAFDDIVKVNNGYSSHQVFEVEWVDGHWRVCS